jgi:hypothetical protein
MLMEDLDIWNMVKSSRDVKFERCPVQLALGVRVGVEPIYISVAFLSRIMSVKSVIPQSI